jgi:hypothetical protein
VWQDFDGDERPDHFVGTGAGPVRLFQSLGAGAFADIAPESGLGHAGESLFAHALDYDQDGLADLHVHTSQGDVLYRNLGAGRFEAVELPLANGGATGSGPLVLLGEPEASDALGPATISPEEPRNPSVKDGRGQSAAGIPGLGLPGGSILVGPTPTVGEVIPLEAGCFPAIKDQSNMGPCLRASRKAELDRLYPMSMKFFVDESTGNVGVNTITPGEKLEVAGTALITDTLTLAPSHDVALDVSSGSVYKGGCLFIHTKGECPTRLNELKELDERFEEQGERLRELEERFAALETRTAVAALPADGR